MTEPLFQPITVKGLEFKNRLIHAPTTMNMSDPLGHVTDRSIGVYESLARGGFGGVTVGATCVRPDGLINERMLLISDDTYIIGMRDLVEAIKNHDARAGIQLFYGGLIPGLGATMPLEPGKGWIPGTRSWGASNKAIIGNPQPDVVPAEEFEALVECFAQGARRAKEAGFDYVSFHFCHGSLPHTNLSLLSNVGRTDKWADRLLFAEEILKRTQEACGKDYPLFPRFCVDENLEGGFDIDYFVENYAPRLQALDFGVLDCTFGSMLRAPSRRADISSNEFIGGNFYTPHVVNFDNIKKVKRLFKERGFTMPVIGSCNLNTPEHIRTMAYEAGADFVGVCRLSMDDPDFPRKMKEGREQEIRKSTRTGASLLHGNIFGKGYAGSPQNPEFGREREYRIIPTARPQKVVIVGGGSGGMEFARVAKAIGHEVVLFEKGPRLGGTMDWAGNYPHIPNTESLRYQPEWHSLQMKLLGIDCRLNCEVSADQVLAEKPDVVVLATGSKAKLPAVAGLAEGVEAGRVLTIDQLLSRDNPADPGQVVTIWGAGEGLELALELSRQGRTVRVIDENPQLMPTPYMASRVMHVLKWLGEAGVPVEHGRKVLRFTTDGLAVECRGESSGAPGAPAGVAAAVADQVATEVEILQSDSVVVCLGREANNPLRAALDGKVRELFVIGDAKEPRSYGNAIHEAAYLARQIG